MGECRRSCFHQSEESYRNPPWLTGRATTPLKVDVWKFGILEFDVRDKFQIVLPGVFWMFWVWVSGGRIGVLGLLTVIWNFLEKSRSRNIAALEIFHQAFLAVSNCVPSTISLFLFPSSRFRTKALTARIFKSRKNYIKKKKLNFQKLRNSKFDTLTDVMVVFLMADAYDLTPGALADVPFALVAFGGGVGLAEEGGEESWNKNFEK